MTNNKKIYNNDNLTIDEIDEKTVRARAIIINKRNEILMCFSNKLNHLEFPGGHLEENETLSECLKREVLEETGIFINEDEAKLFYTIQYFCKNYHNKAKNRLVEINYFIVNCDTEFDNTKRMLDKEEIIENYECKYIKVNKLKKILIDNKKSTKENNSSLDDMLLVWNEFLTINKD